MDKTLDYYNSVAQEYINDTINAQVSDLNLFFLKYFPEKAHILDLGCGSGRDSRAFLEKGHTVTAIDGSVEFCKLASNFIGQEVICKRFEKCL